MNDKVVIDGEINLSNEIDGEPQHWVGASGIEAEPLSVTENGTYTAPSGIAYTPVDVNVPGIIPQGEIDIAENGEYNVAAYAMANVAIPDPTTIALKITENGDYYAQDYDAYGFSDVTVDVRIPLWWVGDKWEKLANCWDETTTLKAVGFDGWTASNTAGTLRASGAATAFSADLANYDYLIRWRFYWVASYNQGATKIAIPVCGATDAYQLMTRRPQNLDSVRSEIYNQNTYALFYTMVYQEYYNTSGVQAANWGNTYGITVTAAAPTYSGGDVVTITPNYPSIGARCNNSYFATARKPDIDSEHSQIRLVGEVYRVHRSALRQTYADMVDVANHGL